VREVGRHVELVFESVVDVLERRDHREDRQPVLVGLRAAGGERPAVVDALDRERDRQGDVARPQEVAVQGMNEPVVWNGALGGDERLGEHLASEDPALRHPLALAGEDVFVRSRVGVGEVECRKQTAECVGHGSPVVEGVRAAQGCALI
jgi:hypothetical protein